MHSFIIKSTIYSVSNVHWELNIGDSSLSVLVRSRCLCQFALEFAYWRPRKLILTRTIYNIAGYKGIDRLQQIYTISVPASHFLEFYLPGNNYHIHLVFNFGTGIELPVLTQLLLLSLPFGRKMSPLGAFCKVQGVHECVCVCCTKHRYAVLKIKIKNWVGVHCCPIENGWKICLIIIEFGRPNESDGRLISSSKYGIKHFMPSIVIKQIYVIYLHCCY